MIKKQGRKICIEKDYYTAQKDIINEKCFTDVRNKKTEEIKIGNTHTNYRLICFFLLHVHAIVL